jgi:hypothetical protein
MITGYAIERLGSVELSLLFEMLVPKRRRCSESGGLARGQKSLSHSGSAHGAPLAGAVAGLPG